MRELWTLHRRLFVAVIVVAVLGVSSAVVLVGSHRGGPQPGTPTGGRPLSGTTRSRSGATQNTTTQNTRTHTTTAPTQHLATSIHQVPQTAIQRQVDAELAQAETPAAIAAAQRSTVAAQAVSTTYPTVATVDRGDPGTYAVAFTTELLDTNFAVQSRDALLAWAEHEEAPNTLPGVPASVASKALVLSLADPDLPGGSPSPVPSAPQWVADAEGDVSQSVADVQAEVAPDWTQIISEGWQPRDPLMTIETVTGTMTVATNGVTGVPESFSLSVTLGSAADVRAGYGAVAVADWTLD
jgi:hypothetical protein